MDSPLTRVLIVDDDEEDFIITRDFLSKVPGRSFVLDWAATYDDALEEIARGQHDVYLLDYHLGGRNGLDLLKEAIGGGCKAPFILLTGQDDHEVDMEATRAGAMDYLVKGDINSTLLERSIRYATERHRVERQKEQLIEELQEALARIKTMRGLLPICSSCKRIRDDRGYWNQLESYIKAHSDADFSHSICPSCIKRLYPEQYARLFQDGVEAAT